MGVLNSRFSAIHRAALAAFLLAGALGVVGCTPGRAWAVEPAGSVAVAAVEEEEAARQRILKGLPVRRVTIFKDGHALVVHEGKAKADANGKVRLTNLPEPLQGTFWPFGVDKQSPLQAAVAEEVKGRRLEKAKSIRDVLRGNVGKEVRAVLLPLGQSDGPQTLTGILREVPDSESNLVYVEVKGGEGEGAGAATTQVVDVNRISRLSFVEAPSATWSREEKRAELSLQFGQARDTEVGLGVAYVQQGLRWEPSYRISVGDDGKARFELQATIVNELTDLEDVHAELVIGVPAFAMKGRIDPIALQKTVVDVEALAGMGGGRYAGTRRDFLSNAMMSQSVAYSADESGATASGSGPGSSAPGVTGGEKAEDLYVFSLEHLTLKRGARAVLPVAKFEIPVEQVFKLTIPISPPSEVERQLNPEQREAALEESKPRVMSVFRFTNTSEYPITTAPALIFKGERLLAQGLARYVSRNGKGDVEVTQAVDVKSKRSDEESGREPNALRWGGNSYARVDMQGVITVRNLRDTPVKIEVRREIAGNAQTADNNGVVRKRMSELDDDEAKTIRPQWWGWYGWPWWWGGINGFGVYTWNLELQKGEEKELKYTWTYYWGG